MSVQDSVLKAIAKNWEYDKDQLEIIDGLVILTEDDDTFVLGAIQQFGLEPSLETLQDCFATMVCTVTKRDWDFHPVKFESIFYTVGDIDEIPNEIRRFYWDEDECLISFEFC